MTRSFGFAMLIAAALAADGFAAPAPLAKAAPTEASLRRSLAARGVIVEKIERAPSAQTAGAWVAHVKLYLPSGEELRVTKQVAAGGCAGLCELLGAGDAQQLWQEKRRELVFNFYTGFNR